MTSIAYSRAETSSGSSPSPLVGVLRSSGFRTVLGILVILAWAAGATGADVNSKQIDDYLRDGLNAFQKGRFDEAAKAYEKAASLDPTNPIPHKNLGIAYIFMKHYREAIEPFEKAVALRPSSADFHYNLARAYQLAKNYPKAIEIYKKTIELEPDDAKAHMHLGELYGREEERLPEAIEELKKSIVLNPGLAEAHYSLAVAYYGSKNFEEAWKSLEEAEKLKYQNINPAFVKALRKMHPEPK